MGFNCYFNVLFLEKQRKRQWNNMRQKCAFLQSRWMCTGIILLFLISSVYKIFQVLKSKTMNFTPINITRLCYYAYIT